MWFDYQVLINFRDEYKFGEIYVEKLAYLLDRIEGEDSWFVSPKKALTIREHPHFQSVILPLKNIADLNDMKYDDFWSFMMDAIIDEPYFEFHGISSCMRQSLIDKVIAEELIFYDKRLKFATHSRLQPDMYFEQNQVIVEYNHYLVKKLEYIYPNNEFKVIETLNEFIETNKISPLFLQNHYKNYYRGINDRYSIRR